MKNIDMAILTINKAICKNIDSVDNSERGFLSQNILAQLRNFVEHIFLKAYSNGRNMEVNYENIQESMNNMKSRADLKFLGKFHKFLQPVASHYTLDEENSERLMLKYYEYLLKIKSYLKHGFDFDVLENIDKFPIDIDSATQEYYEKISQKINQFKLRNHHSDRYYIQKIKPFFVNYEVYHEITFTRAIDSLNKSDRIIAFTKLDISASYAVKLTIYDDNIEILGKNMPIHIITNWEVSIRPCELNNFADIFGAHSYIQATHKEYQNLMIFLTQSSFNLVDLLDFSDEHYEKIKRQITQDVKVTNFLPMIDKCRELDKAHSNGSNIIKYLLYKLNNRVVKDQYEYNGAPYYWDGIHLSCKCIPFDQMPFVSSPVKHNPKLSDLFDCLDASSREDELFARFIKNNTETKGVLYTPKQDINNFENIDKLISTYNNKVYSKHKKRRSIQNYKDFIYIAGYETDTIHIIEKLKELASSGIKNYTNSVDAWLQASSYQIDCKDKRISLRKMFSESNVALIYGSAGTGKSTMINHISQFFNDYKKLYLANTNPATDNLKRKVHSSHCEFKTITKFLTERYGETSFDLLFIDECSTVNNEDMVKVLQKASFTLLILVGDVFQIESINFGNWFSVAQSFIPQNSITELTVPHRTKNKKLLELWQKVRNIDDDILEHITTNNYSTTLDDSIFIHSEDDEIILLLNYDGLYGINNINKFLQGNNESTPVFWQNLIYKIGDPILFNDTKRFGPSIYNNLKGKIVAIELDNEKIQFDIEIDKTINDMDTFQYDFELVDNLSNGNSVIRFDVSKHINTDEDNESSDAVIPFQIAYAVSIHKAQGLEYNSVKLVITNEVEEMITHNIFYTAITRAKEKLKIYWSPETESKILKSLEKKNNSRDVHLLKSKM
ncbi:MAG: helicase [Epsilonproteobacteria bacterium]|nr:helicase [Campylobacterota bacterium]